MAAASLIANPQAFGQGMNAQPVIEVPVQDGYAMGSGVILPAITVRQAAVEKFTPPAPTDAKFNVLYSWISDSNSFQKEFFADASATGTYSGVTGGFKASVMKQTSFGTLSQTLILKCVRDWNPVDIGGSNTPYPKLTADAEKLLAADPAKFRATYGDYFVGGYRKQARLWVVFNLKSQDQKSLTEFKASVEASAPEVFTASGSTSFKIAAQQKNVEITGQAIMDGVKANGGGLVSIPSSPEKAVEIYKQFQTDAVGTNTGARLFHYSLVDNRVPMTLPVDPSKLAIASDIFAKLRTAQSFGDKSTGQTLQKRLDKTLQNIATTVQKDIPPDVSCTIDVLQKVKAEMDGFIKDRDVIIETDRFYAALEAAPDLSGEIDGNTTPNSTAGYSSWPRDTLISRAGEKFPGPSNGYKAGGGLKLEYSFPAAGTNLGDAIIAGYQFETLRTDGHAGSVERTAGGLRQNFLRATGYPSGLYEPRWKFSIWLVPKKEAVIN
jgi:hypothetical protein